MVIKVNFNTIQAQIYHTNIFSDPKRYESTIHIVYNVIIHDT